MSDGTKWLHGVKTSYKSILCDFEAFLMIRFWVGIAQRDIHGRQRPPAYPRGPPHPDFNWL